MTDRRRWDTDTQGRGVADARPSIPSVGRLLATLDAADWVAEEPDLHLLPHLVDEARDCGVELHVRDRSAATYTLEVIVPADASPRVIRAVIHRLIGTIAEASTHVRETEAGRRYEIVTGMLEGDGSFAAHGHVLTMLVSRAADPG